ncbi:PaaI family thioesterase [Aggregicoccus sp. 17bor-14]|uniref:PaaI family thioesterase n=1 Tax=Myxococcaceae TaxID=31 RepID=UPI00129C9BC7|nr:MULTISPECIES: PaaI family thioesterase [Myxococcaceae]MBF5041725.1 PaaI family thioesterase [Simulacricoccus sp. 17bor-14]MRI87506.1 PaaI family thioesterase [Aggregicoccus sp. 17bor-14]
MTREPLENKEQVIDSLNALYEAHIPHNRALGLRVVDAGTGEAWVKLPYDAKLVGNPETGVLHGGCITTLIDVACGAAVMLKLTRMVRIATLDLRIDYLRPARPGQDVVAHAECYKLTHNVAFVRALASHGDGNDPIASAQGTFILVDE